MTATHLRSSARVIRAGISTTVRSPSRYADTVLRRFALRRTSTGGSLSTQARYRLIEWDLGIFLYFHRQGIASAQVDLAASQDLASCPHRCEPLFHSRTPVHPHDIHSFVHNAPLTDSRSASYRADSRSLRENRLAARKGKACGRLCGLGAS